MYKSLLKFAINQLQFAINQLHFVSFKLLADSVIYPCDYTQHCTVCCGMAFSVNRLHTSEKNLKAKISELLKISKATSVTSLSDSMLDKVKKPDLIKVIRSFISVCEENIDLCRSAAEKIDELKDSNLTSQRELIECQKSETNSIQTAVKSELKTWSDVVKKNIKQSETQQCQVTKKSVKEAIATVNEEEKRAKNLMVYGLEEDLDSYMYLVDGVKNDIYDEDEHLELNNVLDHIWDTVEVEVDIGEITAYRVGKQEPGETRPVRVEFTDTK